MRRLAALLTGVVALGAMALFLPWDSVECPPSTCTSTSGATDWGPWWVDLMIFAFYVLLPSAIVIAVLVGVLRLRDAANPSDRAIQAALGETRSRAVRRAAWRGLRDGVVAVGIAYLLAGAVHLAMISTIPAYPLTQDGGMWARRALVALMFVACLVVAHVLNSLRGSRTPVEQLRPDVDQAPISNRSLAIRTMVIVAVMALGAGLVVGTTQSYEPSVDGAPSVLSVVATTGAWIFGLAVVALVWLVLLPLAGRAVPAVVAACGRALARMGARNVAAVLDVRSAHAWIASTWALRVLVTVAFVVGLAASSTPTAPSDLDFAPIAATIRLSPETQTSRCDAECETSTAELLDTPGIGALVPAATVGSDWNRPAPTALLVDPADLDGVDDVLATQLRDHPEEVVVPYREGGYSAADYAALGLSVTGLVDGQNCCNSAIANLSAATGDLGPLGATSFLAYGTDEFPTQATYMSVENANMSGAWGFGGGPTITYDNVDFPTNWQYVVVNALIWVVLGTVVLVPVGAVATAAVARRRRDDATLAALGATAHSLRWSVVVESVLTAAIAVAAGLLGGALTHAAISGVTYTLGILNGFSAEGLVTYAVTSVGWATLGLVWLGTFVVFAAASALASRKLGKLSPVEALQPNEEGVLR